MRKILLAMIFTLSVLGLVKVESFAKTEAVIEDNIYINHINVGGMTALEAKQEVFQYVEELGTKEITFLFVGDETIVKTASEFDLVWINPIIVSDAVEKSESSNLVQKYKVKADIQNEAPIYEMQLGVDEQAIRDFLETEGTTFDIDAVNTGMSVVNGEIKVTDGKSGYAIDIENSLEEAVTYLVNLNNDSATELEMVTEEVLPKGSSEELKQVKDLLGTFTTSYSTSSAGRCVNVARGAELINGTLLYPGETFSAQDILNPITIANGYDVGGAYLSGKLVDSIGGGVCQVTTTLYNAVLFAELEVTERYNHSMTVSYVAVALDAAISNSAGKDFKFTNNGDTPIYIEGITENKKITFNIYGVETREENRVVTYESEILSTINPGAEVLIADVTQPIGYVSTQGSHIGYKSKLWKVVTVDGVEVSRSVVNSSSYSASPRYGTFGVSTNNVDYYNQMMAAIGTGSIDHTKNVAAALNAAEAAAIAASVTEVAPI